MGKIFVCDTSLSEKFSWMEANHKNNEIKSTTKIFTYTVITLVPGTPWYQQMILITWDELLQLMNLDRIIIVAETSEVVQFKH